MALKKKNGKTNGNGNDPTAQECVNKRQAMSQLRRKKWNTFQFKTDKQEEFYKTIESNTISFCTGPAGTGKSYISLYYALKALGDKKKSYDGIILCRPFISIDNESIGYLPGSLEEKADPYMMAYWHIIEKLIGPSVLRQLVDGGVIKVIPLAFFRGLTLDSKIVLYDEAQNSTATAMKSFLTRIGANTKMIIMGDINQADRKGISGLADAISRLETLDETGHLEFTDDDIVRHTIIGKILAKYEDDPNEK